jgi:BlaI family penicillinase repressor
MKNKNHLILTKSGYKCRLSIEVTFVTRTYFTYFTSNIFKGAALTYARQEEINMNNPASKITASEVELMKVLWHADRELPISEIRKALEETTDWEISTIKTLLRRLCNKGIVKATKREVFYYKALVSQKEYNEYSTQNLIDRLYSGSAKNLIASLISSKKLKPEDVKELQEMFKVGDKNE